MYGYWFQMTSLLSDSIFPTILRYIQEIKNQQDDDPTLPNRRQWEWNDGLQPDRHGGCFWSASVQKTLQAPRLIPVYRNPTYPKAAKAAFFYCRDPIIPPIGNVKWPKTLWVIFLLSTYVFKYFIYVFLIYNIFPLLIDKFLNDIL